MDSRRIRPFSQRNRPIPDHHLDLVERSQLCWAAPDRPDRQGDTQMLDTGTEAPTFTVDDHTGTPFDLTSERGHWVLLWWYPKADTPG
jgi:peroxiredoxin Q/BCP